MPKLSDRSTTSTVSGGYVHIILPDGGGGWDSYRIAYLDFLDSIQTQIDSLSAIVGTKRSDLNISATFNFDIPANAKVLSFDIQHISGTVNVDIGTTPGGTEIIEGFDISSGVESFSWVTVYEALTTIYITRNSGTFNLYTLYAEDWI